MSRGGGRGYVPARLVIGRECVAIAKTSGMRVGDLGRMAAAQPMNAIVFPNRPQLVVADPLEALDVTERAPEPEEGAAMRPVRDLSGERCP